MTFGCVEHPISGATDCLVSLIARQPWLHTRKTLLETLGDVAWPWNASGALGCPREVWEALGCLGAWEALVGLVGSSKLSWEALKKCKGPWEAWEAPEGGTRETMGPGLGGYETKSPPGARGPGGYVPKHQNCWRVRA